MSNVARPVLSLKRSEPALRPSALPEPLPDHFWFIWCPTQQRPKKRHASVELALAEAARLRHVAPEREFRVYEAREVSP